MSNPKAARRIGQQNEYLTALHETMLGLMNRLDVGDLVETIVVRAAQLLNTAHGYVYLAEPDGAEIALKVGIGIFKEHVGSSLKPGEGVAGKIWQEGQPLAVRDYSTWPGRAPRFEHDAFRAVVGVPLTSGDQVIGVIGMAHIEVGRVFEDAEIDLLIRFIQLASIALDNARLYASAQQELAARARAEQQLREGDRRARELAIAAERQARELALLGQVRSAMASEMDLSRLFRVVVEAIPAVFGYTLVSLYMRQGDQLVLQHAVGYTRMIETVSLDQGVCWRVMRSGEPVLLEDVRDDPAFIGAIEGVSSEICVPLFDQGRAVGVLNVESTGGVRLSVADLHLMIALSQHAGIAIGRARLYAESRQERDFSSAVVDTMSSLVVVLDRAGRIVRFNHACEQMMGYIFDEVRGRCVWDLFLAAEDIDLIKASFEHLSASQFPSSRENVWVTRSGQHRLIAWSSTALLDAAGVPEYVIGTGVDITERREAERAQRESEQRFRILFEHSPDAIILIDPHDPQISWPIVACNDGACRMNEYTHDELIGQSIDMLNGVEAPLEERVAYLERLRGEGTIQLETVHRRKDSTSFPIEVVSSLISIEGREMVLGIDRDISERKRAEAAVRASEQKYRSVVDHVHEVIFQTDAAGRWTFLNRSWTEVTGFTVEESLGSLALDSIHPDDRELNRQVFQPLIERKKEHCRHEIRYLSKDGGFRWIEVFARLTLDDNDTIVGTSGTLNDITERRSAEAALAKSEHLFRTLVMHAPVGIFQTNAQGENVFSNDRALVLCGLTHEDMTHGLGWSQMLHPDDRASVFTEWGAAMQGGREFAMEFRFQHADGAIVWVSVSIVPITDRDGAVTGYIGMLTNVTERRSVEVALAQARDQALEASRLKSEFLATMSHEIRTPMNGIMGMTELLLDTTLDAEQQEFATVVHDSAQALLTIINDILDFSKIEAGKLILDNIDFDLLATVEGTVDVLSLRARAKQLSLMAFVDPAIPRMLHGDALRLRQVLLNLVGNAVKFTEHGEVVVRAELERATDTDVFVRFSVKDSGIGFSEATRRQLFQPFTQADGSVTRKYGGTGLGLAICRRLVELMGGEIDAVSVEGQGSTFWFTAQIGRSRSAPDAARPRRADLLNLRALVVDDRQTNQDILLSYLRAWGHAANCVAGGVAALAALRRAAATQTPYDLVITDLVMPEMDGFTLGRAIQCDPAIAGTRLILLTAFDDRGQGEQAIQSGFGAYLTKPVKQSQLFDAIANVIADDRWLTPNQEPLPAAGDQSPDTTGDGQPMMDDRLMDDRRRANQLILVVEDNAVNQRLALRQLERLGYPAQVASNGREALEAVTSAAQPYALVLMDCQMPVMDGFAASRAIREWEHGGGSRIPIVAMTANAVQGDREVCLAAGMDDYLSKPVRRDDLRRVLEGWLAPAASAPDATEAPAESPLDRSILEGLRELQAPGEDGLLGELIDLFVADAHIQIAAMQSAIERGDPPALARAAHQFKGSSANLGATALAGRCAELEALGKMQMIAGAVALLRSAEHEFERARRALEVERRAMWS